MVFLFFFHLPASGVPPQVSWWKILLHVDPFGVVLAMGGITCFVLALQYGGITHPWNSGLVIGLLVGFGLLVAALVGWEIRQGDYAMMLPRLYKQRSLSTTAPYQFSFMGSYIVLLYYLPIYFQSILGVSPIQSGVHNLPLVLTAAVFALAGGAVVMKTGRAQQVMFIGSMFATVAIGLIYTLDIGSSTAKWVGYQFFVGATMAFAITHGLSLAQANVGRRPRCCHVQSSMYVAPPVPYISLLSHFEKLADMVYSFSNHWRRVQHGGGSVSFRQQTACHSTPFRPFGDSTARASYRRFGAADCDWAGCASWRSDGLHGWSQGCLCGRAFLLRSCILVLFGNSYAKIAESYFGGSSCSRSRQLVSRAICPMASPTSDTARQLSQ